MGTEVIGPKLPFITLIFDSLGFAYSCQSMVNKDSQGTKAGDVDQFICFHSEVANRMSWPMNTQWHFGREQYSQLARSHGSLRKRLCRSVSGHRLCKKGSRRASLEFYRECEKREQRWPYTADKKISHEKRSGRWTEMEEPATLGDFKQWLTERQKEGGGGGREKHMIKIWTGFV